MHYTDRVYGNIKITEPVILDLLKSDTLQRLKHVDQIGYFEPYFPGTKHSRFEHSVGVYYLLKKFGVSLEEQIAGLIHDVSHSAFSHCIDYTLGSASEKYHSRQDNVFAAFVKQSGIPKILKQYKMDINYILNEHNFPLKEKDLPDLCADRIDYSLRTALVFKEINKNRANYFLNNLTVTNASWVFKDFQSAFSFSKLFLKLNTKYYSGLESALMFRTTGDVLKYALEKKYITQKNLYATDKNVLSKITKYLNTDKKLKLLFTRMNNKTKVINDPSNYDVRVFCKSRVINPLCQHIGKIKRVSDIKKRWQEILRSESKPKEYFLRFCTL